MRCPLFFVFKFKLLSIFINRVFESYPLTPVCTNSSTETNQIRIQKSHFLLVFPFPPFSRTAFRPGDILRCQSAVDIRGKSSSSWEGIANKPEQQTNC